MFISRGVMLYFKTKYCIFLSEDIFFTLTNSVDPDEMHHFIRVFTVCKSTCLGVSRIQKLKTTLFAPFSKVVYSAGRISFRWAQTGSVFTSKLIGPVKQKILG